MSTENLEINLFARSDGEDAPSWLVSISVNQQASRGPTTLRHPFNEVEQSECRWYVEDFLWKSPYSLSRARNAANTLQQYSKSLLDQLGLVMLVKNDFASHSPGSRAITISISEDEGAKHSVHQLHWELLEDPSFWDTDVQVTVRRTVISEANGKGAVLHDVTSDEKTNSALPRVNGLLVVARDLSQDSKIYDDISPHLALGVLAQIQDDLQRNKFQACLNLEVVRPGTLEALEKHLKKTTEIHGKNYYHFVHFDVHGKVKSNEGAGYLKFNNPDPDLHTTVKENAETVADILGRYGVTVAVLNACESARANCADAANIAKVFARSGVQNVLAMSFRISSSAAELVLRAFYHSLFLEGTAFSHAAGKAREVLRLHPERQARLKLKRSLTDYFVPVVYNCGHDSRFVPVRRKTTLAGWAGPLACGVRFITTLAGYFVPFVYSFRQDSRLTPVTREGRAPQGVQDTAYNFALRTAPFASKDEEQLIGREFDLLRLEKKLLAQGRVHLTGRAGVGKSALLRHACGIWQQTSFVDIVLFIDFRNIVSLGEAVGLLVSQTRLSLLAQLTLAWKLGMAIVTSPLSYSTMFAEALLGACSKSRLMIILDGLQVFDPTNWLLERDRSWNEAFPMLRRFMEALLNLGDAGTPHEAIYHIVVSRLDSIHLPFSEVIHGFSSEEILFKLPSLRLSDSMELSSLTLRDAGVNVDNWVDADWNELELLLGLLDGNPSAILHVLPLMSQTGLSIREFRGLVQHGILPKRYAGHANEIYNIFDALCDEPRDFLLLFSTVWQEGMEVNCVVDWTSSHNICTNEPSVAMCSFAVFGGGLIDITPGVLPDGGRELAVTWIHPLLTICGRQVAYEILTDRQNQSAAAALVLSTVGGQFDETTLSEQTRILCENFRTWFLQSLATFDFSRHLRLWVTDVSYQDRFMIWSSATGNLATCLSICTRQPYPPIDQWPLDYFLRYVGTLQLFGSPAQVTEYAKSFEQLFEIFINLNGSLAIPPPHQRFALMTVTHLTVIYLVGRRDLVKYKKYVDIALRIVQESEERFGKFEDKIVQFYKGLGLRVHAAYLLTYGPHEEGVEVWKTALDYEKSVFENPHSPGLQLSAEQIQAFANGYSTDEAEARAIAERCTRAISVNSLETFYKSRKNSLNFIRAVASQSKKEDKGEDAVATRKFRALAKTAYGMEPVYKVFEDLGWSGLEVFSERAWLALWAGQSDNLADLEMAKSTGNSVKAFEHLWTLFIENFQNLELDEVEEYFNSLKRYSERVSLPKEGEEAIMWLTSFVRVLRCNSTEADEKLATESIENFIRLRKERNAPPEVIEAMEVRHDMWLKARLNQPDLTSHYLRNEQRFSSLLSGKLRDKKFMQKLPKLELQFERHLQGLQEAFWNHDVELCGVESGVENLTPKVGLGTQTHHVELCVERWDMFEEFLSQPGHEFFHEYLGKDTCSKLRHACDRARDFVRFLNSPIVARLDNALLRGSPDEALRLFTAFENQMSSESRQRMLKEITFVKVSLILESWIAKRNRRQPETSGSSLD